MIEELERVALTENLPEYRLNIGDVGLVVHVYGDYKGYGVEFVTLSGNLVALASVYPHQIRRIEQDEIASARRVESA
jgi:hypothetical protein